MARALSGRTAVVTGGTRGIGHATAARLLAEGAQVIVTGTKPGGQGPAGCGYRAVDFTDLGSVSGFCSELAGIAPDILVNNAGINRIAPFAESILPTSRVSNRSMSRRPFFCARRSCLR